MKRNAYFSLIHEEDGMYLQSYPAEEGGQPLNTDDVLAYLSLKKFDMVDAVQIKAFVENATEKGSAKLLVSRDKKRLPEKETAVITIDPKNWMAKIRLYPPSSKGERLSIDDLYSLLSQYGVKHGILDKNLKLMWRAKLYCTDVLIAKATLPVQGSHASIEYHFNVDKTSKPQQKEDGSVDFHNLDMIERVTEGQLLATLTPEVEGTPGMTVSGEVILPAKVQKKALKHGKNIRISEDNLTIYSEVSGDVTLVNDTVFVSNVYEVPADVGPSTGDIDYDGSVVVKGNVLTGYSVSASGDITVNGSVEGAKLNAGGKIVLKSGVQGMERAELIAGGDVITNFIESATVRSGARVITDAIMHSQVEAHDDILVEGKRGMIAGGRVRSSRMITTRVAGSTMGTQTELEVGIDPTLMDQYQSIEKEMEKLSGERDGLLQNVAILKKRLQQTGKLDDDKKAKLKSSADRIQEIGTTMEQLSEEYEHLEQELSRNEGAGKIIVNSIAYPGVKLTISNVSTLIHTETKYSAFVRDGADIRVRAI